jgi:bacteriochlorophyll 4-vinyl reductase
VAARESARYIPPPNVTATHSILPLAILEAMRSLDSPSDEEVAEYVDELLRKRLGLSDTVLAQIGRYTAAVKRDDTVRGEEFEQILRLASRRSDAALVFADAGRRAARRAIGRAAAPTRLLARHLPRFAARPIGFGAARRAARDVFGAALSREARQPVAVLDADSPVRATPDGAACAFYAAAFSELLRNLVEFEGTIMHTSCHSRGDTRCEWKTA